MITTKTSEEFYLSVVFWLGVSVRYDLNHNYTIGRHPSCDLIFPKVLKNPITNKLDSLDFISNLHCSIIYFKYETKEYFKLYDSLPGRKPSTNGTYLNGNLIYQEATLRSGDVITFARNKEFPQIIFMELLEEDTEKTEQCERQDNKTYAEKI